MDKENTDTQQKLPGNVVLAFVIGFIIGVAVMWFISFSLPLQTPAMEQGEDSNENGERVEEIDNPGEQPGGPILNAAENTIVVQDQLFGSQVVLENLTLMEEGWVVVHEDLDGDLGNALGARRFDAGVYDDGRVTLLRETVPDQQYHVVLYADNGDREFSLEDDQPFQTVTGIRLEAIFTAVRVDRKI